MFASRLARGLCSLAPRVSVCSRQLFCCIFEAFSHGTREARWRVCVCPHSHQASKMASRQRGSPVSALPLARRASSVENSLGLVAADRHTVGQRAPLVLPAALPPCRRAIGGSKRRDWKRDWQRDWGGARCPERVATVYCTILASRRATLRNPKASTQRARTRPDFAQGIAATSPHTRSQWRR